MKLSTKGCDGFDDYNNTMIPAGGYHCFVKRVEEHSSIENAIIVDFSILNGTMPGYEGETHTEFLYTTTDKAKRRIACLCVCCGLMKMDEDKEVNLQDLVGEQLIIEIEESTYQGKQRNRIKFFGFKPLDHEDAKDVPRGKVQEEQMPKKEEADDDAGDYDDL